MRQSSILSPKKIKNALKTKNLQLKLEKSIQNGKFS